MSEVNFVCPYGICDWDLFVQINLPKKCSILVVPEICTLLMAFLSG